MLMFVPFRQCFKRLSMHSTIVLSLRGAATAISLPYQTSVFSCSSPLSCFWMWQISQKRHLEGERGGASERWVQGNSCRLLPASVGFPAPAPRLSKRAYR